MTPKKESGKSLKSPKSPAAKNKKASSPAKKSGPAGNKSAPPTDSKPRFVVGIGASAGGFEACSQFFSQLPPDTGMAFIVVQHLDPNHESILPELMAKMTRMPVRHVTEGMPLKANEVYVISPNTNIAVSHGMLKITTRGDKRPYMTIDHLFRSLAEDRKKQAVGVLFSGTSSDGALGIEAIKHAGGITFAQDEASARYAFMPNAAVATGCVDFVLNPGDMARELAKISRHPFRSYYRTPDDGEVLPEGGNELEPVLLLLRKATGLDFTLYKRSTLKRRIMRRVVLHKLDSLESYLKYLRKDPGEVDALYQDVLIKVTGFFRDAGAFEALKIKAFSEILAGKSGESGVRFWVPGCSSGEEAYSLAMSWLEFMGDKAPTVPIQIFATDVSDAVIEKARVGIYLENIAADLSPRRLQRFFTKANGGYQISKTIRDMCVFARQNLIQDPPFSKLDLISCRNVLIYLQTALQKRIIPMFHFALKPTGYLMLGASETIGTFTELFSLSDKKYKIYHKKSGPAPVTVDFMLPAFPGNARDCSLPLCRSWTRTGAN